MWLLHFLPEGLISFVVHGLVLLGVVGIIISFFVVNRLLSAVPAFAKYYRVAQAVSIVTLVLGVYLWGGYSMEMAYRERVAELEAKLEQAKQESAKVNTVIETKVVTKTKVIKEKADTLIEYVNREIFRDREIVKEVNNCPVPKEVIDVHNEAAQMNRAIEELRKGAKK